MKISDFLIGMAVIALFTGVFSIYYVNVTADGGHTFDNETFAAYNEFERLEDQALELNESLKNIRNTEDQNVLSFASAFVASGWKLIRTTFTSVDIFTSISEKGLEQSNLGETLPNFKTFLMIFIIVLFVFGVASLLLGRDT